MNNKSNKNLLELRSLSEYPDILTINQMSELLGISTKTAYKLLKDKKIIGIKIGRQYKITKAHILAFLNIS